MINQNIIDASQLKGAYIEDLIWIPLYNPITGLFNRKKKSFPTDKEIWDELFPDIECDFKHYTPLGLIGVLLKNNKTGLIATVKIPRYTNFKFDSDIPVEWKTDGSFTTVKYVYSETLDELLKEVLAAVEKSFQMDIEIDLKKYSH